ARGAGAASRRRVRQRAAAPGHLQAAVRPARRRARTGHRRRAEPRLHVHDAEPRARSGPDRQGAARTNRTEPHPVHVQERYNLTKIPWKWFEGPIYRFINKNNEASMRRASEWLTEHPEYRPD